jgi:S1-C subfamily serine protease
VRREFFKGRRLLATVSLATALAVTGFYGLRAAELGKLPFENSAPVIRTSVRSEAAAGRGYSAVVKRVVPAVVNISTSKVVKQTAMEMPDGTDPMYRQFFGNGSGQGFNMPRQRSKATF